MQRELTAAQVIECFHLAFLVALPTHLPRDAYILKGGANLRYFYASFRYSEDIDFDALIEEDWRLRDKVDETLRSGALRLVMRRAGVEIASISPHSKQTPTTQKWMLLLAAPGHADPLATRIEFSRRNGDQRFQLEAVPENVVEAYALSPPTLLHYLPESMIEQKIRALAGRTHTQARDIFDLDLLFRRTPQAAHAGAIADDTLAKAIQHCLEIDFDIFQGQVIPFLDPEIAATYDSPVAWKTMQPYVAGKLEALR